MTQNDYEQQKRECFVKFCKDNGIDQEVNISIFDAFDQIFDRAYALGKQTETITQEDIYRAAVEYAISLSECGMYDKETPATKEDMEYAFRAGVKFALGKHSQKIFDNALGKQEKDAEDTVIQGWVAIDEVYGQCFLHTEKPIQKAQPIADTGDYNTVWDSKGKTYLLDAGLFSDMDSDSEPQQCEIIIKRKKNG